MNEIKCEVARDLMPLVADDVASEASRTLVNEHMESCENCKAYYAGMTAQLEKDTSQPEDSNFIRFCRRMEKRFKMKRVLIFLIIIAILLGVLSGGLFYFETRNYNIPMEMEEARAQLYVEKDGDVACRIVMEDDKNWYGMVWAEMMDGIYYLTPMKPTYPFMNRGYGEGIHEESGFDLIWKNGLLYYRVHEWDMMFNEETGEHDEIVTERLIPLEYVRWGHPDEYTTLYEKGDILPTDQELHGMLEEKPNTAPTATQAP